MIGEIRHPPLTCGAPSRLLSKGAARGGLVSIHMSDRGLWCRP